MLHVRYDVANIGCGDDAPDDLAGQGDGIVVIGDEVPRNRSDHEAGELLIPCLVVHVRAGVVGELPVVAPPVAVWVGRGRVEVAANLVAIIQPVAVRVGIHRIGHRIRLVRVGDAVTIRIDQCGVRDEPSGDNHLGAVGVVSVVEAVDLLAVGDAVAVRVRIVLVEFERDAVEQHEMVLVPVGDAVAVAVGLDVDELADVLVDAGQCIGVLGKIGFASGLAGEYLHPSFEI